MTISELMTRRDELKADLDDLSKVVADKKAEISQIDLELKRELRQSKLDGFLTETKKIYISESVVPKLVNWDELCGYIQESGRYDLVQKRVNTTTFREMVKSGTVPNGLGVEIIEKLKISKR